MVLGTQTTIQDLSEEKADNQFYDSKVEFLVQPDAQIFRPDRTVDKPQGRPQTATVVGPEGQEIYTDQYGRIKVRFHWDRLHPSHSPKEENDWTYNDGINTCWLRVSTAWAGNNFGTIHLPRIGQEVIVDFFNGDPDMPFVAGRLTNPEQMPLWKLPEQQALSGIKSKELGGSQANQLVMDDTQGQVQVHLKSDHQSSELNLGYITRIPDPNGRKDYRGQGFELRTDGHGVIRSAKGLILTTYAKNQSESYTKNIQETSAQLKQAVEQHKTQTQTAINQKADERSLASAAHTDLAIQEQVISGSGEQAELQAAQVVVGSSTGVAVVAEESIHLNSNEQIALTSGKDVSLVVGERLFASANEGISLFTQTKGARLFAGKDKIELQAQNGGLDAIARQDIQIISTEDKIEITSPKEIILTAGGSQLKINSGGVFITTGGKFEVKAGQHKFEEGQRIKANIPQLPLSNISERYSHRLDLSNLYDSNNFSQIKYYAFKEGDTTSYISGNLDFWGRTQRFSSDKSDEYKLMVCDPDDSWEVIINVNENDEK